MSNVVAHWVEKAEYDLETARAMLESKRYIYVLFCCQQAVEKMLKAVYVKRTGEIPPRLHNLLRLASSTNVALNSEQEEFMGLLSGYYVQTRYPEGMDLLQKTADKKLVASAMRKTEELYQWLSSLLK